MCEGMCKVVKPGLGSKLISKLKRKKERKKSRERKKETGREKEKAGRKQTDRQLLCLGPSPEQEKSGEVLASHRNGRH